MKNAGEINWTQLWVLHELTGAQRLPLSHFLDDPRREWVSPWIFPGRDVLRSNRDSRIEALVSATHSGLTNVYRTDPQSNPRFCASNPMHIDRELLLDSEFAADSVLVLTSKGHDRWEAEFQPDWKRYWVAFSIDDADRKEGRDSINVTYASDEILDDLLEWYPAYSGLWKATEVELGKTTTSYCHSATVWKVLDRVKTSIFRLPPKDPRWEPFGITIEKDDPLRAAKLKEVKQRFDSRSELLYQQQDEACCILERLSKCWKCVDVSSDDRRDADPERI